MSTELRPIPKDPVWKSMLRQSACAGCQHLFGELSLEVDSLHRRVISATILPPSCIFPVINRRHPPATRLSGPQHHTLRVSSTPSLPSHAQPDLPEMRV